MASPRRLRVSVDLDLEPLEGLTLLSLTIVKDINKVPSFPAQITVVNTNVFFLSHAANGGTNLQVQTSGGTKLLKTFSPGSGAYSGSSVTSLTAVGSKLFFMADTDATGQELWVSDGTAAGTHIVKDLNPGAQSSYPYRFTPVGSKLYFTANVPSVVANGDGGTLFVSDGTTAGTIPVAPITPPPNPLPQGSVPGIRASTLTAFNGKLFFMSGNNLDSTTGVAGGTALVHTFPTATTTEGSPAVQSFEVAAGGGVLYISAEDTAGKPAL